MVGTTVKKVMGHLRGRLEESEGWLPLMPLMPLVVRKGAASRSQTRVTLKGNMNSMVEPASSGARRALTVPWMWWRGRGWRMWSFGE